MLRLFTFPTKFEKLKEQRLNWHKLINRWEEKDTSKLWSPQKQSRVCSLHFIDGKLTLNVGYISDRNIAKVTKPPRRKLSYKMFKGNNETENTGEPCPSSSTHEQDVGEYGFSSESEPEASKYSRHNLCDVSPSDIPNQPTSDIPNQPTSSESGQSVLCFPSYTIFANSYISRVVFNMIASFMAFTGIMHKKNIVLEAEIAKLEVIVKCMLTQVTKLKSLNRSLNVELKYAKRKLKTCTCSKPLYEVLLSSAENTKFYTGIQSKSLFLKLPDFIKPFVRQRWRGVSTVSTDLKRKFSGIAKRMGPQRILDSMDEFLLTLMRLRLGLLLTNLQYRFKVSCSLTAQNFKFSNLFTRPRNP